MTKARKTGDEIMDAYAQVLPEDKRSHLPSLKHCYDRLSAPMHAADEDAAEKLFDDSRQEMEHHFELRQACRIPETSLLFFPSLNFRPPCFLRDANSPTGHSC